MDLDVEISSDGLLGLVPDAWPSGGAQPVHIAAVLPDSLAEQHQLCVGDELRCINGQAVQQLEHRKMALELTKRPLKLQIHRPSSQSVVIDVQVDDAGALGFFPKHWPPGPVVIGAVLPKKIAALHGVKEGDFLWLVGTQQASLMTPAGLTEALSRRPLSLRFLRGPSAVAQAMASSTARRNDHEERVEVLQQQRDLQMQQLHLQQLQHRKEQQEMTGSDKDWLNLLEKQQDEKLSMQSEQREHLSKLGESLKLHQDLLQELDRDEGSGYSSTVLPALTIPGVRRPPKPAPFARKSGEATEPSERIEQVEVVKAPEAEDVEIEVEIEEAEEPQDQMETAGLAEKEAPVIEQKQEEQLDELEEKKPEEECLPEQLQVEKAPPQELSDQTTQTDPFCQENPLLPSVSAVATEFSGLKPLSALEPRSGQHFEMPKTRQRQLQVTQMEQQQALPGLVEPSQPVETSPGRRLRVVPPPERPPGEGEEVGDHIKGFDHQSDPLETELQSWLARSSLSADAVIF